MRYGLLLLLLLLLLLPVSTVFAAPAIVVERLEYNFGELVQGEKITETFRFHNAGDQVLEISRLRSSCGCTAALLSSRRLAPGAMGELRLTFDSQGFRGPIKKDVTFDTNDPQRRSVAFALKGRVNPELYIQPQRINWGVVKKGEPLHAELEIINRSTTVVKLRQPKVTSAGVVAKLSSMRIAPGEKVLLNVSAEFQVGEKRLASYILINTDLINLPQLKVSASARLARE